MENKPNLFSREHLLNSRDETEQALYYLLRGYLKIGFPIFQKIQELKQQVNITETSCLESQITDFHYVVLLNTLCIKSFKVLISTANHYTSIWSSFFVCWGRKQLYCLLCIGMVLVFAAGHEKNQVPSGTYQWVE